MLHAKHPKTHSTIWQAPLFYNCQSRQQHSPHGARLQPDPRMSVLIFFFCSLFSLFDVLSFSSLSFHNRAGSLDQSSFVTRITGLLRTVMTMGCLIPYSVNPMSCFSFSLNLAIRGGYWHPQVRQTTRLNKHKTELLSDTQGKNNKRSFFIFIF